MYNGRKMSLIERLEALYLDQGDLETMEWYRLTPSERFSASERLWRTFVMYKGRRERQPDIQSPFDSSR